MLSEDEREAIQRKRDELHPRIKELKQQLRQLEDQKEALFRQRVPLTKEISQRIRTVKQLRHERDQLTAGVRTQKAKRRELNERIRKLIESAKALREEKQHAQTKGTRENPAYLKARIAQLESRIETSVMPFEKEKALMKEIRELKKKYEHVTQASAAGEKARAVGKDIDALRKEADAVHKDIQDQARQSQEKHERLVEESRQIDALKKIQDILDRDIAVKREEIRSKEAALRPLQEESGRISGTLAAERREKESRNEAVQKKKLSDKLARVREKMAQGEKLTTEDFLVLQGAQDQD